jgi:hypothetical protein
MKLKVLALAAVSVLGIASVAQADEYGAGPRPPYASGLYVGLGVGSPDCSFTIAGAQGGITILGISLGGGARLGLGGGCRERRRDDAAYAPQPPAYGGGYPSPAYPTAYPAPAYQTQGGYYSGGYTAGYAPSSYQQGGYPAPQPCPCQAPMAYQPR